ncbi:UNVERIFIED_CONTAM: hypothetical protein HDU68_006047 [Siphonaria sp. JEL0065]|nr:hypothetical protein HDU68_006047 [Siphonaria sp. JEL0065]
MAPIPEFWSRPTSLFCESALTGPPEYWNTYSSVFIVLVGLYGALFSTPHHGHKAVRHMNCVLAVVGIGSIGYHYTGHWGWSKIDQWGEVLLGLKVLPAIVDLVLYRWFHPKPLGPSQNAHPESFTQELVSTLVYGSTTFVLLFAIIIDSQLEKNIADDVVGACLGSALLFLALSTITSHKQFLAIHPQGQTIKSYIKSTIIFILVSVVIWTLEERVFCLQDPEFWSGIPLHAVWHFTSSYGFYLMLQVVVLYDAERYGFDAYVIMPETARGRSGVDVSYGVVLDTLACRVVWTKERVHGKKLI